MKTATETAEYLKNEAQKGAFLDYNEIVYSVYKGYDNIGEFETYLTYFKTKEEDAYNLYLLVEERLSNNVEK